MLKQMNMTGAEIRIRDASFPEPFVSGLEYNAPARGPWNIVHTGMILPESHQIYICAQGCLRGVILTAAEMNAMDRMSWVSLCENDFLDGSLEDNVTEGVTDVLNKMKKKPRAVLVFLSCVHLFAGVDAEMIIQELRERFPEIAFTDCYMNPTMRKNGLTPDQLTRRQLYSFLEKTPQNPKSVNIIGNDRATAETSGLVRMIRSNGFELKDITYCKKFDEYLTMSGSFLNITYLPPAKAAGEVLSRRLGQKHIHLPLSYSFSEIRKNYEVLAETLQIPLPDFTGAEEQAVHALKQAKELIGETAVEIDYTATSRPLGLARLLTESGFRVKTVYIDVITGEEQEDFRFLQQNLPDLTLCATVHAKMRFAGKGVRTTEKVLAVGQKAAYFSGTPCFVNMVAGGGLYGFDGIVKLAELMEDAFRNAKDTEKVIQHKGWGCESCL